MMHFIMQVLNNVCVENDAEYLLLKLMPLRFACLLEY